MRGLCPLIYNMAREVNRAKDDRDAMNVILNHDKFAKKQIQKEKNEER